MNTEAAQELKPTALLPSCPMRALEWQQRLMPGVKVGVYGKGHHLSLTSQPPAAELQPKPGCSAATKPSVMETCSPGSTRPPSSSFLSGTGQGSSAAPQFSLSVGYNHKYLPPWTLLAAVAIVWRNHYTVHNTGTANYSLVLAPSLPLFAL